MVPGDGIGQRHKWRVWRFHYRRRCWLTIRLAKYGMIDYPKFSLNLPRGEKYAARTSSEAHQLD